MKRISILGSTGSIGGNALRVVAANPTQFEIGYLTAGSNAQLLIEQARMFHPRAVAIAAESQVDSVKYALKSLGIEVIGGQAGIREIAQKNDVDMVLNAIVGTAGLEPSYQALMAGKNLALSNKESLVMAGQLINQILTEKKLSLFPVDSEHSAVWQCLLGEDRQTIRKIILTGSGGPFRTLPLNQFPQITPEKALQHPTWNMGRKITIDSATLMNKGLEIIEAHWLFGLPADKIEVIIHPQSIIHSMVEFIDGSIKAQLGLPDMKLPIQLALSYPDRIPANWEKTELSKIKELTFETPDFSKFPTIPLAYEALKRGGTAPAILNVVNEWTVYAFLDHKIKFQDIARYIAEALATIPIKDHPDLEEILTTEQSGREFVERKVRQIA